MPKLTAKWQLLLRMLAAIFGATLLLYLVHRVGLRSLVESVARVGWGLALVIALAGVSHAVKTWAWRMTLTDWRHRASFWRMLQLRLISETAGQVGALAQLCGEGMRVSALGPQIPIECRISSVAMDRILFVVTGAIVGAAGLVVALFAVSMTHALRIDVIMVALVLLSLTSLAVLMMRRRWPVLSASARALGGVRALRTKVEKALPVIRSVEEKLFDLYHYSPGAFWASTGLNVACHGMAVLEVYLVLGLLGVKTGILTALVFESLTKLVNVAGTINPGNVGTYEGGNFLIAKILGVTGAVGLMVAVIRRLRAIFWTAIGGVCLVFLSRSKGGGMADNAREETLKIPDAGTPAQTASPSFTAIILANFGEAGETSLPLLRVGTLPVLLRNILMAQRSGARRIIVCVDRSSGPSVHQELLDGGRLPRFVEWLETGKESLPTLLGLIASGSRDDRLEVIGGYGAYHPTLIRKLRQWNGSRRGLALTSADQPIGLLVLSSAFAFEIAEHCPAETSKLEQLHDWLVSGDSVECEQVEDGLWERVWTVEDRTAAERKLDQWLTKPTDGFFAKMNRRVSVPISRSISMLPITPNMVSLFTLGVGFAAGAFYARGGYWNTLLGAVLSLWSSILDGCDGEIARLKLLESDFGCWLETICDYLYYLFIFAGMAIGLSRSSGSASYLAWGGVLSFGAIATFIVAGRGRQKLAQGRPEQYLSIWHAKADSRRTNPILYFSRHMNFIVRRCFLPYALLVFAVLDATKLAFFLSAVGVNLVWMFALYSHCIFSAGSRRRTGVLLTRSDTSLEGTSESAVSEHHEFIVRISA